MIEIIPNWHPVFVHFPIAFSAAAVFFITLGMLFKRQPWAIQCLLFGRWMLWGAAIFACVAAVFGWFAYNSVTHDDAGHAAMTLHRNWALVALSVLVLLAIIDIWPKRISTAPRYGFLAALIVAWLLVVNVAWLGAEVVFRHGVGVMSLPMPMPEKSGDDGHEHGAVQDGTHMMGELIPSEPIHVAEPMPKTPTTNGAAISPNKAVHGHAPGTADHAN